MESTKRAVRAEMADGPGCGAGERSSRDFPPPGQATVHPRRTAGLTADDGGQVPGYAESGGVARALRATSPSS